MDSLAWDLRRLVRQAREGSRATQAARQARLSQIASDLRAEGFRGLRARGLKPKHVERLTERWAREGLSEGTIKNRMSDLRWWAYRVGRDGVVARSNDHYGIAKRTYVANDAAKARSLDERRLTGVSDAHVRMSLELQREFGLRREEAIKFQPAYADRADRLVLRGSWTKGGRPREVPIATLTQRDVLARAHELAGKGSLIPPQRSYVEQLRIYEKQTSRAGLDRMHGLRHAYAQRRYRELTGLRAPAEGGKRAAKLSATERAADREARLQIAEELGHNRVQITAVYLGR